MAAASSKRDAPRQELVADVLYDVEAQLGLVQKFADLSGETSDYYLGVAAILLRCRADVLAVLDALAEPADGVTVAWEDRVGYLVSGRGHQEAM